MQNFWTVARSGDKENTATNHWYRRPGTTGPNPLQYSAHDATGDKFSPFGFRSLPLPGSAVRTTQLAEGSRRARDPSMARRSLAGDATAGAASRVRFAPTSNNLLVSSWDSVRAPSPPRGSLRLRHPLLATSGWVEFEGDGNSSKIYLRLRGCIFSKSPEVSSFRIPIWARSGRFEIWGEIVSGV